jgi:hypothetical protein
MASEVRQGRSWKPLVSRYVGKSHARKVLHGAPWHTAGDSAHETPHDTTEDSVQACYHVMQVPLGCCHKAAGLRDSSSLQLLQLQQLASTRHWFAVVH